VEIIRHEESAKIVIQAINALGKGNKGLADKLNKDPSLVSRYASGKVRPKAETILQCLNYIGEDLSGASESENTLDIIKNAINRLSSNSDYDLIRALFDVLKVAKKL